MSPDSNPDTPTVLHSALNAQLEDCVKTANTDQTTNELIAAATSMQSPSCERAEPAGMVPTRCISPSATLSRHCGPSGSVVGNKDLNNSVTLSRRFLQEITLDDFLHHKVLFTVTAIHLHFFFFVTRHKTYYYFDVPHYNHTYQCEKYYFKKQV